MSLLRIYYTLIMRRLIIYCEYIKGFINVFFVVNFFHLAILFFKKKNLCFGFDIFNNLLTFHCAYNKCIVTPLFHDKTNTVIRM